MKTADNSIDTKSNERGYLDKKKKKI